MRMVVYMKKKISYALCILMLVFISGCAVNNDTTVNHDFGVIFDTSELSEEENGHKEEILLDIHSETDVSEEETASIGERQQDIKIIDSVEKNMLLYGDCGGNLGFGWLLYTAPNQENQDYKIYFFANRNRDDNEGYKAFEEIDFDLEQADFIFPDAKESNMAIGKFIEIYLYEAFTTESGKSARIVIATYEIDGKQYYDTRIYTPDEGGYGYVLDEAMTEELNALYADAEEYPVFQIIEMPHD